MSPKPNSAVTPTIPPTNQLRVEKFGHGDSGKGKAAKRGLGG